MINPGISILSDNGMVRGYFLNSKELVQKAFDFPLSTWQFWQLLPQNHLSQFHRID